MAAAALVVQLLGAVNSAFLLAFIALRNSVKRFRIFVFRGKLYFHSVNFSVLRSVFCCIYVLGQTGAVGGRKLARLVLSLDSGGRIQPERWLWRTPLFFSFLSLIFRMIYSRMRVWLCLVAFTLLLLKGNAFFVDITYVQSAVAKGAVCLDGSPPAYHFDRGFGTGINNWLIQIEGGGWCNNVTTCLERSKGRLGSSKQMVKQLAFSAILSNKAKFNPDFYNWNRIKVRYCDGASFTGDIEKVDPTTNLHYRGARVFVAIMEDLLAKGMKNAENALLSGCSAGGLTSILHCDSFRALLPMGAKLKCLSDAGYFVNAKDLTGAPHIQQFYNEVVTFHGSAKNLPVSCTSRMNPSSCFFPQNVVPQIRTPLFILNAAYDSWQIKNVVAPGVADPHGHWRECKQDVKNCDASQIQTMQGFRLAFLQAFNAVGRSLERGFFINSCYAHCQSEQQMFWLMDDSPKLANTSIWKAVGDWYFDRSPFQKIDCPFPCDSTCINHIYE